MEITEKTVNGVQILSLAGSLDASTSGILEQRFNSLVSATNKNFVLEMGNVEYVSSGGLRVILVITKKLKAVGGAVVLAGLNASIEELIHMTGFSSLVKMAAGEEQAVTQLSA